MSEGVRREGVSALERVGRARKCWPKQGKTNGMYPKSWRRNFRNAVVGNARLLNRGRLQCQAAVKVLVNTKETS